MEAAIAALHDEAPGFDATDWPRIVALYDVLLTLTPSPVVALNRAVAVAMRDGPEAGLALLDGLAGEPRLGGYHPYAVARADLLARLGRSAEAAAAFRQATRRTRVSMPASATATRRYPEAPRSPELAVSEGSRTAIRAVSLVMINAPEREDPWFPQCWPPGRGTPTTPG